MGNIIKITNLSMYDKRLSEKDKELMEHIYYICKMKGFKIVNIIRTIIDDDCNELYESYVTYDASYQYVEIRLVSIIGGNIDTKCIIDIKNKLKSQTTPLPDIEREVVRIRRIIRCAVSTRNKAAIENIEHELISCIYLYGKRTEYKSLLKFLIRKSKGILAFPYMIKLKLSGAFSEGKLLASKMMINSNYVEDLDNSSIYPVKTISADMSPSTMRRCYKYWERQQLDNCEKGGTNMAQYGIITEQGDLGLGYDPLNEKDNKIVNESVRSSVNKTEEDKDDKK